MPTQTTGEEKDITINSITSTQNMTTTDDGYVVLSSEYWCWQMTFNLTNATKGTMTITAITFDLINKGSGSESFYFYKVNNPQPISSAPYFTEGTGTLTASNLNIVLQAGEECTFRLDAMENYGSNCNGGVKSVKFSGTTPEPATATLSLLALAGMAARRRRLR